MLKKTALFLKDGFPYCSYLVSTVLLSFLDILRNDALLLAPGFNPFLGMRKAESRGLVHSSHRRDYSLPFAGIFENLGVIDLPFNLDIAKKSLVSTMSTLYATM